MMSDVVAAAPPYDPAEEQGGDQGVVSVSPSPEGVSVSPPRGGSMEEVGGIDGGDLCVCFVVGLIFVLFLCVVY